jgi:hypothetical protein
MVSKFGALGEFLSLCFEVEFTCQLKKWVIFSSFGFCLAYKNNVLYVGYSINACF